MGAENSALQGCDLEEPLPTTSQSNWSLHPARRKDGTRVAVFVHKGRARGGNDPFENATKQLKVLRHPTILKFFASCKNSEGTYLITEPVKPLELVLESLTPEEICAGLYNIVEALAFLHDRGKVCHNNICLSSIFVSQDGDWRLGGMEHLRKFDDVTPAFLQESQDLRDEKALAPEEKAGRAEFNPQFGHSRDAYAFGVLAESLLEHLSELGNMTKTFEILIQDEFLNADPKQRPRLATLLTDRLFKNEFLEIVNFLRNITIKGEEEKAKFFSTLVRKLFALPTELVATRLARPLLSRFVLLDETAVKDVVPSLLVPCKNAERTKDYDEDADVNPLFPKHVYREHVIPVVFKIFHVRDAHIRLVLLRHFSAYVELFDRESLRTVILPQILIGLKDSNDAVVAASLHALGDLVPTLGGDAVIGGQRSKIFTEGKPKFGVVSAEPTPLISNLSQVSSVTAVSGVINIQQEKPLPDTDTRGSHQGAPLTGNGVVKNKLSAEAQAKKETEKERRREEAKRRSEERKRKREERKKNPIKATIVDESSIGDTTPSINATDITNALDDDQVSSNEQQHSRQGSPARNTTEPSDWSDDQEDSQSKESDYEDEIEKELNEMESTLSPYDKARTEVVHHDLPPIQVDWSDVQATNPQGYRSNSSKGALKLGSSSSSKNKMDPKKNDDVKNMFHDAENRSVDSPKDSPGSPSKYKKGVMDRDRENNGTIGEKNMVENHTEKHMGKNMVENQNGGDTWDDWENNGGGWGDEGGGWGDGEGAGETQEGADDGWGYDWEEEKGNMGESYSVNKTLGGDWMKSAEIEIKPGGESVSDAASATVKRGNVALGAEFDIMAIEIKPKSSVVEGEIDFFADMQPEIKTKSSEEKLKGSEKEEVENKEKEKKSTISFAAADMEEDASGWGDELDWAETDD